MKSHAWSYVRQWLALLAGVFPQHLPLWALKVVVTHTPAYCCIATSKALQSPVAMALLAATSLHPQQLLACPKLRLQLLVGCRPHKGRSQRLPLASHEG